MAGDKELTVDLLYGFVVVQCPNCSFRCTEHRNDKDAAICGMAHDIHCEHGITYTTADGAHARVGHQDGIDRLRRELKKYWL